MDYKNLCCALRYPVLTHYKLLSGGLTFSLRLCLSIGAELPPWGLIKSPLTLTIVFPLSSQKEAFLVYREGSALKLHSTQTFNLCPRSF